MDEVHSSSFKNIVQGEAVGVRPRWKKEHLWRVGWASCFSCLHSVDSVLTNLLLSTSSLPRWEIRGVLMIFSGGLCNVMTSFLFLFFCVNGYSVCLGRWWGKSEGKGRGGDKERLGGHIPLL